VHPPRLHGGEGAGALWGHCDLPVQQRKVGGRSSWSGAVGFVSEGHAREVAIEAAPLTEGRCCR